MMKKVLLLLFVALSVSFCTSRKAMYTVTCDFSTNIQNEDDIKLLIEQRLIVMDSIDYSIRIEKNNSVVDIFSPIDSTLLLKMLKNQVKDGYYYVYRCDEFLGRFICLNDSLDNQWRKDKIKELERCRKSSKPSLIGDVRSIADSANLAEIVDSKHGSLYRLLMPKFTYSGLTIDSKSVGALIVADLDSVSNLFAESSCIPRNTILMVGNIRSSLKYREVYVIDKTTRSADSSSFQGNPANCIRVYNNKVQETYADVLEITVGRPPYWDLSKVDIDRYANLLGKNAFFYVESVSINAQ